LLQGSSSCILKRCPSHLNLPIFIIVTMSVALVQFGGIVNALCLYSYIDSEYADTIRYLLTQIQYQHSKYVIFLCGYIECHCICKM
jgi:hypothetical protein